MNKEDKIIEENKALAMKEEDILKQLLGEDEVPEMTIEIPRINITLELKALRDKEIEVIRKECTERRKGDNGKWENRVNNLEYDAGLIEAATTNFNWSNPKLLAAKQVSTGKAFILKKLYPGERSFLVNKVLELSGFNDEMKVVEDIKNS